MGFVRLVILILLIPINVFGQFNTNFNRPIQKMFNHSLSYNNRGGGSFYTIGQSFTMRGTGLSSIEVGNGGLSIGLYMFNHTPFTFNGVTEDMKIGMNYVVRHKQLGRLIPSIGGGVDIKNGGVVGKIGFDYMVTYPFFISTHYFKTREVNNIFIGCKLYLY